MALQLQASDFCHMQRGEFIHEKNIRPARKESPIESAGLNHGITGATDPGGTVNRLSSHGSHAFYSCIGGSEKNALAEINQFARTLFPATCRVQDVIQTMLNIMMKT